jgi:tetratricopeptide (TPR) repeat protein
MPAPRVARVFVSSTFLDAVEERDVLAKRIFPEIRRLCRARGVTFVDIDLRWGITAEERAEGDILPLCLAEIDRCRPFFVGILCDRYGWTPDTFNPADVSRFPWLAGFAGRSITELEMLHGALLDPAAATASFFYRRTPRTSGGADRTALERLSERVQQSGRPFRVGLDDATAIGDAVLKDLSGAIDRAWPADSTPDELETRISMYRFFADEATVGYVAGRSDLEACLNHLKHAQPPLMVTAAEGMGKTALLSSVASGARQSGMRVVEVYIGAVPGDSDPRELVAYLVRAVDRQVDKADSPIDLNQLALSVDSCFRSIPATEIVAIVIDAADAVADRENAADLTWLPRTVPANVRMLVSSRPGRPVVAAQTRDWATLEISGLDQDQIVQIATAFLGAYGKRLDAGQLAQLSAAGRMVEPLLLRTVLGELRLVGGHDTLDDQLAHYLVAQDAPDLFRLVLERLERDFGTAARGGVRDVLEALWAARDGLSESEIAAIAGGDAGPLPRRILSALLLGLGENLRDIVGRLRLSSDAFSSAVAARYLVDERARTAARERLAAYFKQQELSRRKIDEYPWQLLQAGLNDRLHAFIGDVEVFLAFPAIDGQFRFELMAYWQALGPGADVVATYLEALNRAAQNGLGSEAVARAVHELAFFFALVDRRDGARVLRERELKQAERAFGRGRSETALYLNNLAQLDLGMGGNRLRAAKLLRRAYAALQRGRQQSSELAGSILDNLGQVDPNQARRLRAGRRALHIRIQRLGPQHRVTLRSMNNLSVLLLETGRIAESMSLALETLRLRTDVLGPGDYDTLTTESFVALLWLDRGFEEKALALALHAQHGLAEILGDHHHRVAVPRSVVELALIRLGRVAEAEAMLARRTPAGPPATLDEATWANNLGQIRRHQGRLEEAEELIRSAISVAESHERGNLRLHVLFQISLAEVFNAAARSAESDLLLGSIESALGKVPGLGWLVAARVYHDHAVAVAAMADVGRARRLARRALAQRIRYAGPESRLVAESNELLRTLTARPEEAGK